jgi:hypothetical protein
MSRQELMKSPKLKYDNKNVAQGIISHFISRNNDIDGYWGIGVLARSMASGRHRSRIIRTIRQNKVVCEINGFRLNSLENIVNKFQDIYSFDSITLQLECRSTSSFFPNGMTMNAMEIIIIVLGNGKIGIEKRDVACWLHDPNIECRRLLKPKVP